LVKDVVGLLSFVNAVVARVSLSHDVLGLSSFVHKPPTRIGDGALKSIDSGDG
jgi:hypothetical protein